MQSLKFYTLVGVVGGIADYATRKVVEKSTEGISGGLNSFYQSSSALNTAILAGVTFIAVVFVSDLINSNT